jgi:hypothetical protein
MGCSEWAYRNSKHESGTKSRDLSGRTAPRLGSVYGPYRWPSRSQQPLCQNDRVSPIAEAVLFSAPLHLYHPLFDGLGLHTGIERRRHRLIYPRGKSQIIMDLDNRRNEVLAVATLFSVLSWTTVCLRFYVRGILKKTWGKDDYFMGATLVRSKICC